MSGSDKFEQNLKDLIAAKSLFGLTGVLQEIQEVNIKILPIVAVGDKTAVTEVDVDAEVATVKLSKKRRSKQFSTGLRNLASSIQFILGSHFEIVLKCKDEELCRLSKVSASSQDSAPIFEIPLDDRDSL